jgi:glutathione synthase/RimK-type ligase-like ATP-grasp enzyme
MKLAIATSAEHPELWEDDRGLPAAFARLGVDATPCVWTDPTIDWAGYDAIQIRSTWDYFERFVEFRAWLDHLDAIGTPTINDTAMMRWNADKRYLPALATAGADIIDTTICAASDLRAVVGARGGDVVVKPTTGGNAWHTVRGAAGTAAFGAVLDGLPRDLDYVVQPYITEIETAGEWSLIVIGGEFSHGARKLPAAGDYRIQHAYGGQWDAVDPAVELVDAAGRVLGAAAALGYADPAYARVDGIVVDGVFRLMELEMIEPFLALHMSPGATERLADAITARLSVGDRRPR